jgi:hypothetical protein
MTVLYWNLHVNVFSSDMYGIHVAFGLYWGDQVGCSTWDIFTIGIKQSYFEDPENWFILTQN